MKLRIIAVISFLFLIAGCDTNAPVKEDMDPPRLPEPTEFTVVEVPDSIKDKVKARGEQENAVPELIVESPKEGETIESSTVKVKIRIAGDLKGYKMGKAEDGTGNHVHVILDNQPYAAHYMWDEGFELRNVTDGEHTLRMFPSRPWHQSYKNEKAFAIVKFTVKNGKANEAKPTTDDKGTKLADAKKPEGTDVKDSNAGDVDLSKPLLTYSRPKGTYKGDDVKAIMIDFWLSNAKLKGDGGKYMVSYSINGGPAKMIEKWEPVWVSGWKPCKNTVKLQLVDKNGKEITNGGYNSTIREIRVNPETCPPDIQKQDLQKEKDTK
ncbi:MAG: hypothetical protein HKN33_11315 [Pyrinomonadaceae bacterium]|nr:hypothetical protein [Pyrinomonadaceae bacterium]